MPSFISITIVSEQSSESVRNQTPKVHYNHWNVQNIHIKVHRQFMHKKYRHTDYSLSIYRFLMSLLLFILLFFFHKQVLFCKF